MFKKLILAAVFLLGLASLSQAAESKYAKLYLFDAFTNGPITAGTSQINAFLDLVDPSDYLKAAGLDKATLKQSGLYLNDLQNNEGSIVKIKNGDIPPEGYSGTNFQGNTTIYLGRYSIIPYLGSRFFRGGVIIQFNFIVAGSNNTVAPNNFYVSQTIPFFASFASFGTGSR